MKKGFLLFVLTLLTTVSFAQYTVEMVAQEYKGNKYYQGELSISGSSFVPELGAAYEVEIINLVSSAFIGELCVNIVDRSAAASYWTELNPAYAIMGTQLPATTALTQSAKVFVTQTADDPTVGKYSLVFQIWKQLEGIDTITLNIEDIKLSGSVSMFVDGYTDKGIDLQVGDTYDLKSKFRYSQFEQADGNGYPTFESDNSSIVSVDANGVMTAVAPGTATITTVMRGKLLVDVSTYTAGTYLLATKKIVVNVRPVPTISMTWNSYGTDVEGIGFVGLSDYWQYCEKSKISAALDAYATNYSSVWTPSEGDKFTIHLKGTADVSGSLELGLVDEREEVDYWGEMSVFEKNLAVTAGEEFDFTIDLPISVLKNASDVAYATPDLIFAFMPTNGSCWGSESDIEINLDTYEVTFTPKEVKNEPIIPQKEYSFCVGEEATALKATAINGASLVWYDSEKTVLANAPVPSTETSGTQYFYVSQKLNDVEGDLFKITVTVTGKLTTPTVDATEKSVCAGTPVTFTVTSDGTVAWINSSNNIVTTDKTLSQTEMSAGTKKFGVYATSDENSCGSDTVFVTLTLKENPTVYIDGNSVVQQSESFSLVANATSKSSTIESYKWKIASVDNDETSATLTTSLTQSAVFTVTVTDKESCSASAQKYVAVSGNGDPLAELDKELYSVEIGGTLTITPIYNAINDFSNLTFLLKEYNGCLQFEPQIDGSCKITGISEGTDSLIMNLTYSDGVNTYNFIDTCKIAVVPSDKVAKPAVAKTEYVYCQMDTAEQIDAKADEGATLQWYKKGDNGLFSKFYADPIPATDYPHEDVFAVSQIIDGLEGPKVTVSVLVKQKPTVTCELVETASTKDTVALKVSSDIGTSYVWKIDGVEYSTKQDTAIRFTTAKEYQVSVVTTADNGCTDTQDRIITTYKKVADPEVAKTSYVVCQGDDSFTLSATATENTTLAWYNAKNELLVSAPTITTENVINETYYVSQINSESEEGDKVAISVVVNQKPTISFDLATEASNVDEIVLQATSNVGTSYVWSINDVEFSTEQNVSKTFAQPNDYKVSVVTTTDKGCTNSTEKTISIYRKVEKPTVPTTSFAVCQGDDSFTLSATADDENQVVWYNANNEVLASAPVITTDKVLSDTYFVSQKDAKSHEGEKVEISVVVKPTPELTVSAQEIVYVGSNVEIQATSDIVSNFEWSTGEKESSVTTSQSSVVFDKAEVKSIEVAADANGCVATSSIYIKAKDVPSITFDENTVTVYVGEIANLQPTFNGLIAGNTASWSVDNSEVATVENQETGVIKALAVGETKVTYTTEYFDPDTKVTSTYSGSYQLIVEEFVETVECKYPTVEMFEGENFFADAIVHSISGASSNYHLETSKEDSLKVDIVDKMITAVEQGEVALFVVSDEKSSLRSTINITIKEFIPAKEISLPKQVTLLVGSDTTLVASIIPANASYAEVTFLEKDDDIITVTADGKVIGKSAGTSIVTASTKEGMQAQTLVYVTSSDEEIVKIRLNDGEESVYLKVGESKTVSCQVSPTTIKANDLKWSVSDPEVATVSPSGILTANKEGEMFLYISYKTIIDEKIKVFVTKSNAPTISFIPDVALQQPGSNEVIDLRTYIFDDVTDFEHLVLTAVGSDDIKVSLEAGVATLSLNNSTFIGNSEVTFGAIDEENLMTTRTVKVQVNAKPNEAPVIVVDTIEVPFAKSIQLTIADLVTDDYTSASDIRFKFDYTGENLLVNKWKNTYLRIQATESSWSGSDIVKFSFVDADNLTTTKDVVVVVRAAENKAPVIAEIPQQNEIGDELFQTIDLSKYVTDDYTSPSAIVWSATTSENVSVKFSGCYAEIADLNEYWRGAEVITFTAMDQGGLTSSIDVTFYRMVETTQTEEDFGWYGKPQISVIASRYYGTLGDEFTLIGTYYGSNCSSEWVIDGVELDDPSALVQNLVFNETGVVNVSFRVMYGQGAITSVDEQLTVLGIEDRNPTMCKGDTKTLTATSGVDSYVWSTGETTQSITVNPDVTAEYSVTMKKGLTRMVDAVELQVSVPVQLAKDSVMCAGTSFELAAEGEFESYSWNTGETTSSIVVPAKVASYEVTATDAFGCESTASFAVTKVNELPSIDLGGDKTMCDKKTLPLDAGEGYTYEWNITKDAKTSVSTDRTIVLDSSAYVIAKITDNNMCQNADTITVTFTYPYPEQIGVVTYSQSSKNVIIAWERTADVNTESYIVQRQLSSLKWKDIDTVSYDNYGIIADETTNYEQRAYKYRLVTVDGCGNKAYSGEYRSSYIQEIEKTTNGKYALRWWTYQSPRDGNVVESYLLRATSDELKADGEFEGYETIDAFSADEDYIGWTDEEGVLNPGDRLRVAFVLDKTVYENAIKDTLGNIIEYSEMKAESGPFALAISNIAEVENENAVVDLFPGDVVVYPTVVTDVINVGIVSNEYNNFTIAVVDANGKVVATTQTGDITKAIIQIPADLMTQGVYTVEISVDGMKKSVKVVK